MNKKAFIVCMFIFICRKSAGLGNRQRSCRPGDQIGPFEPPKSL